MVSEDEIRHKLEEHLQQQGQPKAAYDDISHGPKRMNRITIGEERIEEMQVDANEPMGPQTKEKLRDVLQAGSFSFSPKEREVLQQILSESTGTA